jgi:hypothetical protein
MENTIAATTVSPALVRPRCCSHANVMCSSEPQQNIASAESVGLAMRLVQRLELRMAPTIVSQPAANVAAAGPCISSSRKMKTSPAANELFEAPMRTGKKPATIAITMPASTCATTAPGSMATLVAECITAARPSRTTVHQYAVALRL